MRKKTWGKLFSILMTWWLITRKFRTFYLNATWRMFRLTDDKQSFKGIFYCLWLDLCHKILKPKHIHQRARWLVTFLFSSSTNTSLTHRSHVLHNAVKNKMSKWHMLRQHCIFMDHKVSLNECHWMGFSFQSEWSIFDESRKMLIKLCWWRINFLTLHAAEN